MKISHTADIHIRSLSRHSEYKYVFNAFIEDCKLQKVDHIFVGGDIYHLKTSAISPEYIDLLTWWLNEMSKVAHVHLVLGNHDLNLSNLSRQDAVSPIVDAMNNPRVHLYKNSGVYQFSPGYNFCVFSICDEAGWANVKPVPGDVNIATFHGPVRGCVTETGWDINEEDITVDVFKDYDFCFLGDIHKQQFLGYRDGKPWIGYSGTPIQQNYAEQIDHSYLLWDIKSKNDWCVVARQLPNPNPFVTIDWAGDINKLIVTASSFPNGSRFRIRSDNQLAQKDVHILSETLKTSLNALEVTYKHDSYIDTSVFKTSSSTVSKTDLRSPEVITQLLKDHYTDLNLSNDDVIALTDTAKVYLSQVSSSDDLARNSKWSLRKLEWDNTFAYGEKNTINFQKLNGIVGIFGPNRTGKSSIVGTLMYSLFNASDRGPIKNINICNVRKDYCSARAILDHNGSTYVIERQTVKSTNKKGAVTAATNLNLFKLNDAGDEVDDLCGEQRNDTEKSIRSLLGTPEDFLITSLSAQGETNQFLSQGSSKRRAALTKFLDLDVFDMMHELSSKEVSSVKSQLKNFPDRNWDELLSHSVVASSVCVETIKTLTDLLEENQTTLSLLKSNLSSHNASPVTLHDVISQENRIKEIKKKEEDCRNRIESLEVEIVGLHEKSTALQNLINSINATSLREKQENYRKLQIAMTGLHHIYEKEDSLLTQQKKSLKILDDVPCGDEYSSCKFIKDAHINKRNLSTQIKKVENSLELLNDATASLEKIKDDTIPEKLSKFEKAKDLISKVGLELAKNEIELVKQRSVFDSYMLSLTEANKKLVVLQESLDNDENEEVLSIRSKIAEIISSSRQYDLEKLEQASKLGKLQLSIEKLNEEKLIRDNLLQNVRMHELISSAFSKKGIPLLITKLQLPIINAEISKILQGIVDFTIEVESDEETDSLEIYINYGDSKRIIELCSGMEKTISALALRVAMINISSLPKPDFFIIDEGFGTLDSAGVEACGRLLTSFKRFFKTVIVITHVDGIKDSTDVILEITKNEKDSKIELN